VDADRVECMTAGWSIAEPSAVFFAAPPGGAMGEPISAAGRQLSVRISPVSRDLLQGRFEVLLEELCPDLEVSVAGGSDRGAVDEVVEGLADLAVVVGELTAAHEARGATSRVLGYHIAVLATQQENEVRSLTQDHVRGVLNGRVREWQQIVYQRGAAEVVLGPEGLRSERSERLLMPGERYRPDVVRANSEPAAIARVGSNPAEVVVASLAALAQQDRARAVAVDGVRPSVASYESGRYPYGCSVYLVYSRRRSAAVNEVLAAVQSSAGRRCLRPAVCPPKR